MVLASVINSGFYRDGVRGDAPQGAGGARKRAWLGDSLSPILGRAYYFFTQPEERVKFSFSVTVPFPHPSFLGVTAH
jgi:hypothetical protein